MHDRLCVCYCILSSSCGDACSVDVSMEMLTVIDSAVVHESTRLSTTWSLVGFAAMRAM